MINKVAPADTTSLRTIQCSRFMCLSEVGNSFFKGVAGELKLRIMGH